MPGCLECGGNLDQWDVPCDGCHRFVHKDCTNGYLVIERLDGSRRALLFCKECEAVEDEL